MNLNRFLLAFGLVLVVSACWTQESKEQTSALIGGPCEGCEAIHEYGNRNLSTIDTLPDFVNTNPKLKLTGTVFQSDGKTPAPNVIIYAYHTNRAGIYESSNEANGWGRRHGRFRGWVKTDKNGIYTFYTFRPGAYPSRNVAEHIHMTVLEPDKNEYYIDEVLFDDDPILNDQQRKSQNKRGGSGIIKLVQSDNMLLAKRDIILGKNIPNYPK